MNDEKVTFHPSFFLLCHFLNVFSLSLQPGSMAELMSLPCFMAQHEAVWDQRLTVIHEQFTSPVQLSILNALKWQAAVRVLKSSALLALLTTFCRILNYILEKDALLPSDTSILKQCTKRIQKCCSTSRGSREKNLLPLVIFELSLDEESVLFSCKKAGWKDMWLSLGFYACLLRMPSSG